MEFRLLGPLEVREGERAIPVGAGKARAVLALLLLETNRVVATDRLIDELWGERPPATAGKALQLYVSRLRKALGPAAIATQAPGYALRADPEDVDVHRFERLVEQGRQALAHDDCRAAAELFEAALALWHGPALADLAYEPFAQPEIARLEELRLAALEERVEADLRLGRHAALVGELESLVARHPLRERLRGQLMLALHRSGRTAEALEAYRRGRRALVEELGLEPGQALQALEREILNQDPALAPPPETAPRERPAPAAGAPPVREERKLVTVLCAVVEARGDPELLRAQLETVRAATAEAVAAEGGRLEPGAGPTLIAVFGAPVAQEDHARRAASAARALVARLRADHGDAVQLRAGLESGEVVAAVPADGQPAVVGAPVGEAMRLAAGAAPGEVRMGPRAAAAARGGSRGRLGRVFVGRITELDLLRMTARRVAESGQPHLATVLGEPGVGKSSLVRALRGLLPAGVGWYVGRCPAYGRALTYRPLADVLLARLDLDASAPPEELKRRLGEKAILGLALGLESDEDIHPMQARDRLQRAWLELLEEIAADGPAVVVVEDLHWAEEPLLELLELVSRRLRGPLLILATSRPELLGRTPAWAAGRNASRLWLEPLARPEAERMLDDLAADLPPRVRDLVLDRTEGNPFFVEETLSALLDRGILRRQGERWAVAELPGDWIASDTLQAALAARIDLLPAAAKEMLQAASVIGRAFWEDAVQELVEGSGAELGLLEERDFVRRRAGSSFAGRPEYVFKHALIREVAHDSLPLARRARLHAAFAEWLERVDLGRDEHAPLLAHHYAEAVATEHADFAWTGDQDRLTALRQRAVHWLSRAAELAFARYEMSDAAPLYRQAAELEAGAVARTKLLEAAARASIYGFDTDGFRATTEEALALHPPRDLGARLYASLSREASRSYMWPRPPARVDVERWIERALELAEPGSVERAAALAARAQLDPAANAAAVTEAVELAERLADPYLLADAYETAAVVATAHGNLEEAARLAERKLRIVPQLGDSDRRCSQYMHAAIVFLRLGRVAEGRRAASRQDELAAGLTPHHRVHGPAFVLLADMVGGSWEHARGISARMEAAAAANAGTPCQFNWRGLLMASLAHAQLGDDREARRLERSAAEAHSMGGALAKEPALLRLALLRGELETLQRLLAAEPELDFWDVDYPAARLDALVALGDAALVEAHASAALALGGYVQPFALRALGAVRRDDALLERAAARFEELQLGWRADETRALIAA